MLPKLPHNELIELCRKMLVIRHFEEALIDLYEKNEFRGHYHVYIGQEATGVPALACVQDGDYLFSTHRNHGHLLARGADPGRLFAEILGRRDGYNKGKGGTFHSVVPSLGFHHTSAIVAGILPLAAGTAYAAKRLKSGRVTVALFGDGALEEGAAAEAFNLASLNKLPVLFLCENNGGRQRGAAAAPSASMAAFPLTDIPRAYKIAARQVNGADAGAVHAAVAEALAKVRAGEGPQFIEALTVRWPGNEASWPIAPAKTSVALAWNVEPVPEAARGWYRDNDPVLIFVRELVGAKVATREEIAKIEQTVQAAIQEAVRFALASPYPEPETALEDVFA
ncbi:MAG TPA: thiamine pyrophosphate-dependent dehydrogenase E1 component subunit alpha [Candidatus Acidoferrales bacterium]|nr:thiamine pyrophosphate-dependent dehydrogenase E1 component subunit alpha [Candidatus Acidoferrales bacterium]